MRQRVDACILLGLLKCAAAFDEALLVGQLVGVAGEQHARVGKSSLWKLAVDVAPRQYSDELRMIALNVQADAIIAD